MADLPKYLQALNTYEVRIVKMGDGEWGEVFFDERLIHISRDINLHQQLTTLLHECLHVAYPKTSESKIVSLEGEKWAILKPEYLRALLDKLYP